MENLLLQFEKDLKLHLENAYNSSIEEDEIIKLDKVEKNANDYVDNYLLETNLIAGDVSLSVQHVLDQFIKSKIK